MISLESEIEELRKELSLARAETAVLVGLLSKAETVILSSKIALSETREHNQAAAKPHNLIVNEWLDGIRTALSRLRSSSSPKKE